MYTPEEALQRRLEQHRHANAIKKIEITWNPKERDPQMQVTCYNADNAVIDQWTNAMICGHAGREGKLGRQVVEEIIQNVFGVVPVKTYTPQKMEYRLA